MDKYDVFISCTRQDENHAREIYNFLMDNRIKVFMPSENLPTADDSNISAISEAISQSTNMIVFASFGSSFDSRWVDQEWRNFQRLKKKGLKPGKIVLILQYISPEELAPELRQFEAIPYDNYEWSLLQILKEPAIPGTEKSVPEVVIPKADKKHRPTEEKYDVFISCKSEDYASAEEIYDYLVANHVKTFLASTELRRLGESEYRRAITSALKVTEHLIVYASRPEYIDSRWVYYEWDMFVTAKIKGFKQGNIVTVLNGVKVNDINMDLWKYESIVYGEEGCKEHLLNYVSTEASRDRALKAEELRLAEEQARLKKQHEELIAMAEVYANGANNLKIEADRVRVKMLRAGVKSYKCPVCATVAGLNQSFCPTCGWIFSPIDGIEGAEYLLLDKQEAIITHRQLMKSAPGSALDEVNARVAALNDELRRAITDRESFEKTAHKLHAEVADLNKKLHEAITQKAEAEAATADFKKQLDELRKSPVMDKNTPNDSAPQASSASVYSIYLKYVTTRSMAVIRKYNSELTDNQVPLWGSGPNNVYLASFPTRQEAEKVKNSLEYNGATVELRQDI